MATIPVEGLDHTELLGGVIQDLSSARLRNSIRAIQELAAFCSHFRLFTAISFFNLLTKLRVQSVKPAFCLGARYSTDSQSSRAHRFCKPYAVFCGDIMHSPLQTRYPELSPYFDVDPALAARTRRDFMERYCDTDTLCCTAHFPSPSTGKIRRHGNGFSCEAAS